MEKDRKEKKNKMAGGSEQKRLGRPLPRAVATRTVAPRSCAPSVDPRARSRMDKGAPKLLDPRPRFPLSLARSLLRERHRMPKP